jgi:hypothetical protein
MEFVKNFAKFVAELNESPDLISSFDMSNYENNKFNNEMYNNTIKNYNKIKIINYTNLELSLFLLKDANIDRYRVLDENNKLYIAFFYIDNLNKDGLIQLGDIWNHSSYKGLMGYLWQHFIINLNFKALRCDGSRTYSGKQWFDKYILIPCLNEPSKFLCYIKNIENIEYFYPKTYKEFEDFYSKDKSKEHLRIIIKKLKE